MKRTAEVLPENDVFEAPTTSRGLVQVLWQRKSFVILGALFGLALGFLYHINKSPVYESTGKLVVIRNNAPLSNQNASQSSVVEDVVATNIVMIQSPVVIAMAIKEAKLNELKTFENVDPHSTIQQYLNVGRDNKSNPGTTNNIIVTGYRGPVPEDCKEVLNGLHVAFQNFLDGRAKYGNDKTFEAIIAAKEQTQLDLKQAQAAYESFRKNNAIFIRPGNGLHVGYEVVMSLENDRHKTIVKTENLKIQIAVLKKAIDDGDGKDLDFINSLDQEKYEMFKIRTTISIEEPLIKLRLDEMRLLGRYGENHPDVLTVRKLIETERALRTAIAPKISETNPAKRLLSSWLYTLTEWQESIKSTEKLLKEKRAELDASFAVEMTESQLSGEIQRFGKLYHDTAQTLNQLSLNRNSIGYTASVISPPRIGEKVAPVAYQNLTAGLMLGLLLGVGLAYLADIADKSFRSPEEIRDQLGLPLVGHIPFFKADAETTKKRLAGESTIEPMLCCYFKPKSLDSEAYRAVRTALFFSTQGQGLKVIQVTSPNKGDGKSLMIANLAITTAQSGKRVLLIDADCRRPRQHKIFNLPNDIGLTSVLTDVADRSDSVREACVPGLFIMGSGPIPPNPSELLVSPKFKELLDSVRDEYDFVFVDTPPLLAVTDPCVVASKVDGLFLAIRLTRKGRPDAERAREILHSVNCKVFGIVVNGVTRVTSGLYSSQAYDYTDTYVDYENEDKDYYYADEDPDEAPKKKAKR